MPTTYKPGDTVLRDGAVQCNQYSGTRDRVKKGPKFAPCDHWGAAQRQGLYLAVRLIDA